MEEYWKNRVDFVACPNHDTNVGWGELHFIKPMVLQCRLCKKIFTIEEIRYLIVENYQWHLQDIRQEYMQNMKQLQYMSDDFEPAQQSVQSDDGDSLPSQAVSKPNFLSTLAAFFKSAHRR